MANKSVGTFDANDNLTSSKLPTGATTTMAYANATYKYSPTRMTNPQGNAWNLAYDPRGNLASVSDSMPTPGTSRLAYNANGTVSSSTDAKGAVTTFGYDALSRVTSTTDGKGQVASFTYDALDRPTQTSIGGITVTSRYDAGGRLVERGDATGTTTFVYDAQNRLVEERLPAGRVNAYTYDAVGNLTSITDANGNQSGSSAGQSLAYNPADQTTSLKKAGGTALPATYAGLSQVERATAGTTTFTNTVLGVSAGPDAYTRDPAGALAGIRGANRSYYLFDGLGSVVALTNASGSVTNSYAYDPFGVTTETKALLTNVFNPWRYTGQYQDTTTGLYKMGVRYYQPELGRWTQPDPVAGQLRYAYALDNPVNFVDPDGDIAFALAVVGVIVVVGLVSPFIIGVDSGKRCTDGDESALPAHEG